MKIKVPNGIIVILILSGLLVLAVSFIPSTVVRIVLGLPFLLFFPGYVLIAAVFVKTEKMNKIELVALSIFISIAIVALIGFGLNYTSWGIQLDSVIISLTAFIAITSVIVLIRRAQLPIGLSWFTELYLRLPDWKDDRVSKSLSIFLILCILGVIGILGYTVIAPKVGETFTEFYILGLNGEAEAYPNTFTMNESQVTNVSYYNVSDTTIGWGKVTLGIVNHERKEVTYYVVIQVDGEVLDISYNGIVISQLSNIKLQQEQRRQLEIGFAPKHVGDNQKVEILLFKDENKTAAHSLHLWINVKKSN